jgi:GNAT superfamily N-acetyltransferase
MMKPHAGSPRILPVAPEHREDWEKLYAGYAAFYKVDQTPRMRATVWAWLLDPAHEVQGVVAVDEAGRAIGLAHFRPFARPLSATTGGFLDDLFVSPEARGSGAAQALIEAVADIGRQKGWSVIRWITADDNYRARAVYDCVADRTKWLTYEIKLA